MFLLPSRCSLTLVGSCRRLGSESVDDPSQVHPGFDVAFDPLSPSDLLGGSAIGTDVLCPGVIVERVSDGEVPIGDDRPTDLAFDSLVIPCLMEE